MGMTTEVERRKRSGGDETAPSHARRFGRVREARAASMLEDCTELIADLIAAHGEARMTDIASHLGVAHPTASKAIARLKREGLAETKPYRGVFLTPPGQAMAERSRRRHRLVVDLLVAVGAPRDSAEADAEGVEHYVSDATLNAFEAFLKARR
jgi:DtxR family transcriptional regulator, manganese transport regulator